MTKPQITRRTLLGGIAACFAVAAAPAPSVLAIAPVGGQLLDFEIQIEEWANNPCNFGSIYRCRARHGDKYAYAMANIETDVQGLTLERKAMAREEARRLLLRYFRNGGGSRDFV